MLLTPQHFQQESARLDALVAWQTLAANPYAWGVRRLELDEGLLSAGLLRVTALEAILPGGVVLSFSQDDDASAVLELDLTPWTEHMAQQELSVYLVVGRTRSLRAPGQPSMFRGVQSALVDDQVSEALAVDIPRMATNAALVAGPVPAAVHLHLRLMTLGKDNEVVRRGPALPALLEVAAGSALRQRAQALAASMRSKAVFLAQQTAVPSSRLDDRLSLLEQKSRLSSLTLALPVLEAVLRAPVLQPMALFLALCAQLGPLATLRPGAVPLLPPAYDHADPFPAFDAVLNSLGELVDEVSQEWKTRTFGYDGQSFLLEMQPEWVGQRLVVGLRGQAERESALWMAGAVIGSRTVWTQLSERRVLGASRRPIDEAPELALRASAGYTLFAIEVSDQFITPDQPLLISNGNESSQAQRPHELVLFIKG